MASILECPSSPGAIFAWAWPSSSATWKKSARLSPPSSSTTAEINNAHLGWENLEALGLVTGYNHHSTRRWKSATG
ncbi:MAG TPA: hypothetical protein VF524_08070 [Polyangia bacterium]